MVLKSPAPPFYSPKPGQNVGGQTPYLLNNTGLSNIPILVTAFLAILATGGPTYSFGVYAATLKHSLGLTQSQLETLGAASFGAGLISWIPGLTVDAWGSRSSLMAGGLGQSVGLGIYWSVARFQLVSDAWVVPVLSLLSVLIFTSNNLVIGGVFKAIVVSCGLGSKGKAVGAAKAYLGLGAGVFSSLFHALPNFARRSDLDFLAMSCVCAIVAIVFPAAAALPTSERITARGTKDDSTDRHYYLVYIGLFALALVVVGSSALTLISTTSSSSCSICIPEWVLGLLILTVWIGPIVSLLLLSTHSGSNRKNYQKQQSALRQSARKAMEDDLILIPPNERMRLIPPIINVPVNTTATAADTAFVHNLNDGITSDAVDETCETPQPIADLTLIEMLHTLEAWLFIGTSTILVGSGTMLTINMGQLVQSQRYAPETAAAGLALFSVAQGLARVTTGAVSESALQWETVTLFGLLKGGVPRTAFLVLSCAFAVIGHAVLALNSSNMGCFVLGIIFTGCSFGAMWPLMVLIVGDLFGTVNHGANYMFMDGFTCAIGTLSIAKFMSQTVYEMHIPPATEGSEPQTACYGDACFQTTHRIISGLCLVALLSCLALLHMTRNSYGKLVP